MEHLGLGWAMEREVVRERLSYTVASSLPSFTSLTVAALPPGIHLLGIRVFWGVAASVSLSDSTGTS